MTLGTVFAGVSEAVERAGEASWRTVLALKLAVALDAEPNASMARELRSLMAAIEAADAVREGSSDVADDLRARRERRISGADAGEPAGGVDVGG